MAREQAEALTNPLSSTQPSALVAYTTFYGGEGGIRTHGPIAGTHAFQACRFDHSRTSPHRISRGGILTRGLMTGKVTTSAHRHGIDPPRAPSYTATNSRGGIAMKILIGWAFWSFSCWQPSSRCPF